MSDTLPEADRAPATDGCPVDHLATAAAACPVHHQALAAASRPTSTCAHAPGAAKRGYLVPGVIAFVLLLVGGAIINITDFSHGGSSRLEGPLVASQIASSYQGIHRSAGLPTVSCPQSVPVQAGRTFTCRMSTDGGPERTVTVTETGRGGFHYDVS